MVVLWSAWGVLRCAGRGVVVGFLRGVCGVGVLCLRMGGSYVEGFCVGCVFVVFEEVSVCCLYFVCIRFF